MHVLNGFSQRRKSSKPRDLHIRKVSFSGCSLSSGSDFSSSPSSTLSASTPRAPRSSRSTTFDPLALHPTFQPPPRLHDRPLLSPERRRFEGAATFFDDSDGADEGDSGYFERASEYEMRQWDIQEDQPFEMELPPHASPMDHEDNDRTEPQDYFLLQLRQRPQLPKSRWSASTVYTLDQVTTGSTATPEDDNDLGGETETEAMEQTEQTQLNQLGHRSMPNFSYKRETVVVRRPPMKTMDSLEDFIKRGGWKRRGIVFDNEDMEGACTEEVAQL
ncbi:hypothetical protein VFPFJ_06129 [Purpureocillium lilacinum]|uniref:Uncharacterized protein n=1 Tax=Purpureocillium lilacinum TaxID=33203 RepID=A0A179FQB2_PURLI|nr:hypothetical protein VFPFJ_06129 [Purpureocillium lilacinum]KAK4083342.1 hypothetical protein Purlil1_10753 [Purpureocillium lilacinum]OAQ67468.1 hypothetical protein VFPBJ_11063 [Purpureocillium lilacinum]OAQ89715.1 hypothetical protein VFPFJ_06129 [Purpureocillium lilacinum]GJN76914.1 hypothetical protein PLIIFM63780_000402 [Purpureocillium lilacinum]